MFLKECVLFVFQHTGLYIWKNIGTSPIINKCAKIDKISEDYNLYIVHVVILKHSVIVQYFELIYSLQYNIVISL